MTSITEIPGVTEAQGLVQILSSYSFNYTDEKELQLAIGEVFSQENVPFEREFSLTAADKIDFKIGTVGVEIKIGFSFADVARQLHRYAASDDITDLILVTTKIQHHMPAEINGKRLWTVNLGYSNSL